MKEYIYKIAEKSRRPNMIAIYAVVGVLAVGLVLYFKSSDVVAEITDRAPKALETDSSLVSIVGDSDTETAGSIGNSWPAEIISSHISQVQPQREGVISDWRVKIGEAVYQGQVIGKISAPPGTPELISMLSEQTESLAMAKASAKAVNDYTNKEQIRLSELEESLNGSAESSNQVFSALQSMRENVKVKEAALRSFIERALANHVAMVTNFTSWKYVRSGGLNGLYGIFNQNIQHAYEITLITLVEKLKSSADTPILEAQEYFGLAVQLANNSGVGAVDFKNDVAMDQKDFLDFLSEYKEAQAEVADKETEYKLMIKEQGAMLEKEKAMAEAGLEAAEQAYSTVFGEIKGETPIRASRSGSISAIYKKVGDLVDPAMSVAVIAEDGDPNLIARIRIPSNVLRPKAGDILSAERPGFPNDKVEVKIVGVGTSLDETGSYMADAVFLKNPDWPVQSSVRILQPESSVSPVIPSASVVWDEDGKPYLWSVSANDRIYRTDLKIGRLLGASVEIYDGIKKGEKYITAPTPDMRENMFLDEIVSNTSKEDSGGSSEPGGHESMPGMEM